MAKFSLRKTHKDLKPLQDLYSEGELAAISKHGSIVTIAPGQNLFEEGSPGSEVAIIIEGSAKVSKNGSVVARLNPGDVVGETAVLTQTPRQAKVCAYNFLKLSVLNIEGFASVLNESEDFRRRVDSQMQDRTA